MNKRRKSYHHGNLAESLLDAVDSLATQFGLEAVTLRACARQLGVAPSSAFRHYADKRALLTAFAVRALNELSGRLEAIRLEALEHHESPIHAVSLAYIQFALDKPSLFRVMWRDEMLYVQDEAYVAAVDRLSAGMNEGFVSAIEDADPENLSTQELLLWSSVHGLAGLLVDGPVGKDQDDKQKLELSQAMITALMPALLHSEN